MTQSHRNTTTHKAQAFLTSAAGKSAHEALMKMVESDEYNTAATFSPSAENGSLLFVDKHMNYLCTHQTTSVDQYLSNLRLITKIR